MKFEMKWVPHGSREWLAAVELRRQVLRIPLDLDFSAEELAAEGDQFHLVVRLSDATIGCLVLARVSDTKAKMRQVAVGPEWQGDGIGRAMVLEFERKAAELGCLLIELHARQHVEDFYLKLGYTTVGEPFEEVTLPHVKMIKTLLPLHAKTLIE